MPVDASATDAAAAMARALGRGVTPVPVPRDAWTETLVGAGLGQPYAALLCEMYEVMNAGHVRFSGDGEQRRGQRTLDDTVRGGLVEASPVNPTYNFDERGCRSAKDLQTAVQTARLASQLRPFVHVDLIADYGSWISRLNVVRWVESRHAGRVDWLER